MAKHKEGLNPQQLAFLQAYLDIRSDTFGNAKQSAIAAKYSEEYADNILSLMPKWLSENVGDAQMLLKAEKTINRAIDIDVTDEQIGDRALKASMFVAERLGKNKYSTRQELTGKDGKDLLSPEQVKERLKNLKK